MYYYEFLGKDKGHEGKKYLMVNDFMLDRQYNRHDTEILIDTDDKLSDYNILKNVVILTICVIEDGACQ